MLIILHLFIKIEQRFFRFVIFRHIKTMYRNIGNPSFLQNFRFHIRGFVLPAAGRRLPIIIHYLLINRPNQVCQRVISFCGFLVTICICELRHARVLLLRHIFQTPVNLHKIIILKRRDYGKMPCQFRFARQPFQQNKQLCVRRGLRCHFPRLFVFFFQIDAQFAL